MNDLELYRKVQETNKSGCDLSYGRYDITPVTLTLEDLKAKLNSLELQDGYFVYTDHVSVFLENATSLLEEGSTLLEAELHVKSDANTSSSHKTCTSLKIRLDGVDTFRLHTITSTLGGHGENSNDESLGMIWNEVQLHTRGDIASSNAKAAVVKYIIWQECRDGRWDATLQQFAGFESLWEE